MEKKFIYTTLPAPVKAENIPVTAQWLGGEGAGSWFVVEISGEYFEVTRYSPEGNIECCGIFFEKEKQFNIQKLYEITYLSHCEQISILQEGIKIILKRKM